MRAKRPYRSNLKMMFLRSNFYFYRMLFHQLFRRYLFSIVIVLFISSCILEILLLSISYSVLIYHSPQFHNNSSKIIVSLTTTPTRFHYELPYTIHSLLSQTQLPKQIRIYLSPAWLVSQQSNLTFDYLKIQVQRLDSSEFIRMRFEKLVKIRIEEQDYGPATKYLPILKEFHLKEIVCSEFQPVMICDDDQYYHRETLATFNKYIDKYSNSIIGLRGWRIRKDLNWGVRSSDEIDYHIIQSYHISDSYQVGVVTANSAYIIRPSFFDSKIYDNFNELSDDIRHVDDIWINGHASKRNISRYVIPSCCEHIGVTKSHALEQYLRRNRMTRSSANNHALKWFKNDWEKHLWYKFHGENHPNYRNLLVAFERQWKSTIAWIDFVINFGFVYI